MINVTKHAKAKKQTIEDTFADYMEMVLDAISGTTVEGILKAVSEASQEEIMALIALAATADITVFEVTTEMAARVANVPDYFLKQGKTTRSRVLNMTALVALGHLMMALAPTGSQGAAVYEVYKRSIGGGVSIWSTDFTKVATRKVKEGGASRADILKQYAQQFKPTGPQLDTLYTYLFAAAPTFFLDKVGGQQSVEAMDEGKEGDMFDDSEGDEGMDSDTSSPEAVAKASNAGGSGSGGSTLESEIAEVEEHIADLMEGLDESSSPAEREFVANERSEAMKRLEKLMSRKSGNVSGEAAARPATREEASAIPAAAAEVVRKRVKRVTKKTAENVEDDGTAKRTRNAAAK